MAVADDIKKIIEQEKALLFPEFSELTAFSLGSILRERAVRDGLAIVGDVRLWDRQLMYFALPGTGAGNPHWVRRKANTVQRLGKSSYRTVLEKNWDGDVFPARWDMGPADFVLAGGGFPIRLKNAGIIGCVTVSGLHERDDHNVAVDAVCEHLGVDRAAFALAAA